MLRSKLISPNRQGMPPCANKLRGKQLHIILLLLIFLSPMFSMAQNITLKGENITLKQVFSEIKKQTNYAVVYSPEVVNVKLRVTIDASNQPLQQFLSTVLSAHPYTFGVVGSNIFINKKEIIKVIQSDTSSGRNITGFVMDDKTTQPVRSVTITVNGSNQVTQTDENGKFVLKNVPEQFTITLSCIGYDKVIRKVMKADGRVVVPMTQATSELDQVVIQAYGTTSRRMATGNITKVAGEEIWKQPVMNPLIALQGKVAGLQITPIASASSAPVKVEIRGRNSLNPNSLSEPLYVIDGIPQTVLEVRGASKYVAGVSAGVAQGGASATNGQSPMFNMNPRDIESIEVLKDGDATAIYGSRGANGVVLITTKRAKPGTTNFDVSLSQGFVMPSRMPKLLNTQEYVAMRKEALQNAGIQMNPEDAYDLMLWDTNRYTNWAKELMGTGKSTSVNAGFSGGDARTSFRISGEYTTQDDLNNRSGHNIRTGLSFNINHKSLNQKFSVSLNGSYYYTDVNAIIDRSANYLLPPNAPAIFNEKGKLNYAGWIVLPNRIFFPFDYILNNSEAKTNTTTGRLTMSYILAKGLVLSLGAGLTSAQNKTDYYTPIASQNPASNQMGRAVLGRTVASNMIMEPELNYTTIIGRGELKATLGATSQTATTTAGTTVAGGFSNDDLIRSISNGTVVSAVESRENYRYAAVFGRLNYDWDGKYFISLSGRRDGSSKFVKGKQYGNFGSIGVSWNVSEEEWMKSFLPKWFSFLKLRGSAAVTGNDNVRSYEFSSQWASRQPGWNKNFYDYNGIRPFIQVVPPNQEFQWEVVKKYEGGIHLGFLDNKINVEVATYLNRAGNQITSIPLPLYTGTPSVLSNWVAVVDNSGIEATIGANLIRTANLRWNLSLNIGRNRNRLVKYPGIESSPYALQLRVGESLNTKYLIHYLGVNPLTGEYMFEDRDKDGLAGSTRRNGSIEDDYYVAVDMNDVFNGGLTSNFSYKNVSLSLGFGFRKGKGNNPVAGTRVGAISNLILAEELMGDYWRKPGDIAKYPRIIAGGGNNLSLSDASVVDILYLRLNNLTVSYSLPDKILKLAKMKACSFSANIQNVFTITNYAMDPDILNGSLTPVKRVISASLQFTF